MPSDETDDRHPLEQIFIHESGDLVATVSRVLTVLGLAAITTVLLGIGLILLGQYVPSPVLFPVAAALVVGLLYAHYS